MPCNFKVTNGASTSIVSTSSNTVSTSASTISTSASTVSSSGNIMSVSVDSKYSQYLCQIVSMKQLPTHLCMLLSQRFILIQVSHSIHSSDDIQKSCSNME